jgi:hypothetical protein
MLTVSSPCLSGEDTKIFFPMILDNWMARTAKICFLRKIPLIILRIVTFAKILINGEIEGAMGH